MLMDGIVAEKVTTPRYTANVLRRDRDEEIEVVLIHGNVSSSLFYQPLMLELPVGSIAIDLRGFGESEVLPVDATRGARDFSDDVASVLDALGIASAHIMGWSMGAGILMQLMIDRPDLVASATLQAPPSPYGFGGVAADGTLLTPDAAGTGAGGANPDFVARLAAKDTSSEAPTSPRNVFWSSYVAKGYATDLEDLWVESMLSTSTGLDNYPGDGVASTSWPGFGPGKRGVLNSLSPLYFNTTSIVGIANKPPVLWVRGDADAIVGDASFFDINMLGQAGVIPGWPGLEVAPPQPMIAQTRAVLDDYAANGGSYREVVYEGVGHSPHLERPEEFLAEFLTHIGR